MKLSRLLLILIGAALIVKLNAKSLRTNFVPADSGVGAAVGVIGRACRA